MRRYNWRDSILCLFSITKIFQIEVCWNYGPNRSSMEKIHQKVGDVVKSKRSEIIKIPSYIFVKTVGWPVSPLGLFAWSWLTIFTNAFLKAQLTLSNYWKKTFAEYENIQILINNREVQYSKFDNISQFLLFYWNILGCMDTKQSSPNNLVLSTVATLVGTMETLTAIKGGI